MTNANVGMPDVPQPAEHPVPERAEGRGAARGRRRMPSWDRSAPTAKMNGLPVTAMASGAASMAVLIAASRLASPSGPRVDGRVWSRPLSRVISATRMEPPGAVTADGNAATSPGVSSVR